jgi:preprotein translocase subunit SecA
VHIEALDQQELKEEVGHFSTDEVSSGETKVTIEKAGKVIGQETYGGSGELQKSHGKLGRNDPCWCGSGKKYKKCHYPN